MARRNRCIGCVYFQSEIAEANAVPCEMMVDADVRYSLDEVHEYQDLGECPYYCNESGCDEQVIWSSLSGWDECHA